jgi:isoquinoline 1-oxidoreductase beta subunit
MTTSNKNRITRDRNAAPGLSRRDMLAGSAGLSFAFVLGSPLLDGLKAHAQTAGKLNAYVTIAPDGTITIMAPAPEMGQAVNTSIPLIIAEELDADWSKVRIQQSPIAPEYAHPIFKAQFVVGSVTLRGYWMPIRIAARKRDAFWSTPRPKNGACPRPN